ncbi:glycosyltransferase family 2 protein [Candidatus Saccharibacteria bacterium]|nr:glycosyltransferase family 2 protein [Candidatus Saccharibacteria bacterium]
MKVLSIIIPTYNTELYIERCLDSLLYNDKIIKYLDIIIVNDGSSDASLKIAKKYQGLYYDSVKVVDKKNGGHGSAVNAGLVVAVGKYVRVLDSDDWVDIDNFKEYVERLKDEKADLVVTDVRKQHLYDESELDFKFKENSDRPISIEKVKKKVLEENFFFEFSIHSMTILTERLKEVWGDGLLEKTFYVDQQFVAKIFMCAKNFIEYHINIYMYFIGRPGQSMGEGFFKHINDHERVLRWLLKTTDDNKLPEYYRTIVSRQIILMLRTHYGAYDQQKLSKQKKAEIINFDKFLKNNYGKYYQLARVSFIMKRILNPMKDSVSAKMIRYYKKGER